MPSEIKFHGDKHVKYIQSLDSEASKQTYEYWLSEHLRLNGLYWGITALATMNRIDALPRDEVIKFVLQCYDESTGGFAPFPGHDAHILPTLSGLQVLLTYDALDALSEEQREGITLFILSLKCENGSFKGDSFGEVDTRFVFTAVYLLQILGKLTKDIADAASKFILSCRNFDGGFGLLPGSESHAAQAYTCLGTLAICEQLLALDNRTPTWLSERQVLPSGGFNGRPEKLPDVCYSWWVLLCLSMMKKAHWISFEHLESFILQCQDYEKGGFSDRPDNQTDVFHTCFAITALSLLNPDKYGLKPIDPIYCMPLEVTERISKKLN